MAEAVRVRAEILEAMLAHARREPQMECCGLLAGRDAMIDTIFPATNALASAAAYEIAPAELFRLFHFMHDQGMTHLGIYHSHLATVNAPSPSDIEQAYYPDQAYFIVSPQAGTLKPVRAFSIQDGLVRELEIEVLGGGDNERISFE